MHTHFLHVLPICMLSWCLVTKFLHLSSVGRVRCWLGMQKKNQISNKSYKDFSCSFKDFYVLKVRAVRNVLLLVLMFPVRKQDREIHGGMSSDPEMTSLPDLYYQQRFVLSQDQLEDNGTKKNWERRICALCTFLPP